MLISRVFLTLIFGLLFCFVDCSSQDKQIDRQPAVAGQFYPADRGELEKLLGQLYARAAASKNLKDVVALISPHAGYIYSGITAASAFNQISPEKEYETIFIIGSSHHLAFEGASIYTQGNFITPLGPILVNTTIVQNILKNNAVFSNRMDAHTREHSLEVQLPLLQYRLKKKFSFVPIVIGTQSTEICQRIADALRPYVQLKNLFVISTDFSHYPSDTDARIVDKATADAIISNSPLNLIKTITNNEQKRIPQLATSLCGWTSVLTLLYMTEKNPLVEFTHIEYKNSGDSNYGEKNRVVGYHAIAVSLQKKKERQAFILSDQDKRVLLKIARKTVIQYVSERKKPAVDEKTLSQVLKKNCGAFVTLKKHGNLRGCIGRFEPDEPLYKIVQDMAIASSTQDYRFSPVDPNEMPELEIEISVLTPMQRISTVEEVELGRHGIYIRKGNRSGTFLPQVATETGWTKEEFLGHCAQDKAGIGWNGWKEAEMFVYEALVFSEKEFDAK
jgi:AmmeMemoRadiSam system protein B/AmmeMemoRadiSam system protein A